MTDTNYSVEKFTDLAVSTLTSGGGKLRPEQSDSFFRKVMDRTGLVGDIRSVQMTADTMNINKIGLGSRILTVAPSGTSPYLTDGNGETYANNRNLPAANRFSPSFEQVQLTVKEYMAEIHLTDDVIENNLEGDAVTSTIMDMASQRLALDIEEAIILGDTANGGLDPVLQLQDGVLKRIVTNVVDLQNAGIGLDAFAALQTALPTKYLRNLTQMKYYIHNYKELAWRQQLSGRGSALGDSAVTTAASVPALGIPLQTVPLMPQSNILFTDPKNIICGIQRDMRLETQRLPRARMTAFIFTIKFGIQLEQEDATAKAINLG